MVAIVTDPWYLKHSNGAGHPESPERLQAVERLLASWPYRERLLQVPAREATLEELTRVHSEPYVRLIEDTARRQYTMLDPDTGATADSYRAALRAAGGGIEAVEAVLRGRAASAFALVRPPGHHAERDRAMGFCLFNNIAVAAAHLLSAAGLQRVLIVDWDVHHGNGTMHAFYGSADVLYLSLHQYPHYPGTGRIEEAGRGAGEGYSVNVPLPGGQGDADYLYVFRRLFEPLARQFRPEMILVSAGFDPHRNDPLASMAVSGWGFAAMTRTLGSLAGELCGGRLALFLEGGYALSALTEGVDRVLRALEGVGQDEDPRGSSGGGDAGPSQTVVGVVDQVARVQRRYWQIPA